MASDSFFPTIPIIEAVQLKEIVERAKVFYISTYYPPPSATEYAVCVVAVRDNEVTYIIDDFKTPYSESTQKMAEAKVAEFAAKYEKLNAERMPKFRTSRNAKNRILRNIN